jgi:hypothetical protein
MKVNQTPCKRPTAQHRRGAAETHNHLAASKQQQPHQRIAASGLLTQTQADVRKQANLQQAQRSAKALLGQR